MVVLGWISATHTRRTRHTGKSSRAAESYHADYRTHGCCRDDGRYLGMLQPWHIWLYENGFYVLGISTLAFIIALHIETPTME